MTREEFTGDLDPSGTRIARSSSSIAHKSRYRTDRILLPERDYVTFRYLCVVCLYVTLVHPTQRVEAFGNISSPLCSWAIF